MRGEKVQFGFIDKSVKVLEGLRKDWNVTDYWKECEECRKSFIDAIQNNYGDIQKTRSETLKFKNELDAVGNITSMKTLLKFSKIVNRFKETLGKQTGTVRKFFGHTSLFATPENREKLQKLLNEFNAFIRRGEEKRKMAENFQGFCPYTFYELKILIHAILYFVHGDSIVREICRQIGLKLEKEENNYEFVLPKKFDDIIYDLKKCSSKIPYVNLIIKNTIDCLDFSRVTMSTFKQFTDNVQAVPCEDIEIVALVALSESKNKQKQEICKKCEEEIKRRITEGGINDRDKNFINQLVSGKQRMFTSEGKIRNNCKNSISENRKNTIEKFLQFMRDFNKI